MNVPIGRLFKWSFWLLLLLALVIFVGFALYVLIPAKSIPDYEPVGNYVYLDQGWGNSRDSEQRQTYYYTPQGTSLPQGASRAAVRYDWFVHLERPLSQERFADPIHMRSYRFIVDPAPSANNPDQLPIGFTKHFDPNVGEYVLDITCAACHTGQIEFTKGDTRHAIRIDGGQAMHAFTDMARGNFGPVLLASMISTYANPIKFNRFANRVIGARYPEGKSQLRGELGASIKGFLSQGQNNPFKHLYPVQEGFGRTDALGRIANTVFGDHLVPGNYQVANAPVSFPYVWNIWKFDWVQYNGSVKQPLARNIGEAMGVGAIINLLDSTGDAIPAAERYSSSVDIRNLVTIEHTLQKLTPPRWPEEVLGPINQPLAAQGKTLFEDHCQHCHGPHVASAARQNAQAPGKLTPGLEWLIRVLPVERIGTDPTAAVGFVERRYDMSAAGLTSAEIDQLLRPPLTRKLARDTLYRLQSMIELRTEAGLELGELPQLLEQYPDPNADPVASIPTAMFSAIETELRKLISPLPQLPALSSPKEGVECELDCHELWLAWDVIRGPSAIDRQLDSLDVTQLSEGQGLNIIGLLIKRKFFADYGISYQDQQCIEGFGSLDLPQQIAGYKPRPLEGVWATPPFLHNGSVPNLYQMLLPPEQRSKRFFVGRREFDPVNVGYVTEPIDSDEDNGFWLDTSIVGNHNTGHAFTATDEQWSQRKITPLPPGVIGPEWTDKERLGLVEYLKIHRDNAPETPADYQPPQCGPWLTQR